MDPYDFPQVAKALHDQSITRSKVGRHYELDADESIFLPGRRRKFTHGPKNCWIDEWGIVS